MRNFYLKLIFLANGIFVFGAFLIGPIFAIYLNNLQIDVVEISLSSTIFLTSTTLFLGIISIYGDRERHRGRYLIFGFLMRSICWFSFIFVDSILHVYILQILLGLGDAIGSTAFDVMVSEQLKETNRVKVYSTWKFIQNFAAALSTMLGGIIVQEYGFATLFICMSVLALIAALVFAVGIKSHEKNLI